MAKTTFAHQQAWTVQKVGNVQRHTFGSGRLKDVALEISEQRDGSGVMRLEGMVFGFYTRYCTHGHAHADLVLGQMKGGASDRLDFFMDLARDHETYARALAELAVAASFNDWMDPCERTKQPDSPSGADRLFRVRRRHSNA